MAGVTPQLSYSFALPGTNHLRYELNQQHRQSKVYRHASSSSTSNTATSNNNITTTFIASKVHHNHHPHQQATRHSSHNPHVQNVQSIPIRLLIDHGSVFRATSIPSVAKVGVTLPNNTQSSTQTSNLHRAHPPLARLHNGLRPPRPLVPPCPDSPRPRIIHINKNIPEIPPPYEQHICGDINTDDSEPIECPSVLAGGSPRKEKKRSLRSRLLRHITGQKAAAQAARRNSMARSQKCRTPVGSPQVRPRGGCTQLIIQPTASDGNVQIIQNGAQTQIEQINPSTNSRLINVHDNNDQLANTVNNEHTRLHPTSSNCSVSNSQVILLHTVQEEETFEPNPSVNASPHTINVTNPLADLPPPSPSTQKVVSSGASQPPSTSSHSSVFISSQSSTKHKSFHSDMNTDASNVKHKEVPIKVPQSHSVDSSLLSRKNSEVTSGKSPKINDEYFSQPQCSVNRDEPIPMPAPGSDRINHRHRDHNTKNNNTRKKERSSDAQQKAEDKSNNNSFTINLKPGMYKLNLNFANKKKGCKTQTINITVPASDSQNSTQYHLGRPPSTPEPLYYENSSKISLPQRFVHLLKPSSLSSSRTQNSRSAPKVTIVQKTPDANGTQVITVLTPGENKYQQVMRQQPNSAVGHRRGISGCPTRSHKKERYRLAERKKAEGNEAYRNKEYRDALQHYTQAIELCPDCAAYYSNRSACYMMISKYREALNDAQKAVSLDNVFVKGWLRVGKCHVALGDGGAALSVLRQAQDIEPGNSAILQEISSAQALQKCVEDCRRAVEKKDYRTAVFHLDQALRYAMGGLDLRIAKAEYLTFLGRCSDAEDIVNDILIGDNNHADALYVRGLCRYYQDNQDAAFQHFQKVLRLVPDHNKAKETYKRAKVLIQKKEQGNAAFKMGDFAKAMDIYSEALEIDKMNKSTNSKLYCNRATVASKLGKLDEAIKDCSVAIELDDGYVKAYLRRANTYQQTEQFEEAVRDLEKVYRINRTPENKRLLQDAKVQLKRSKRKDYYKILGVSKTASDDEIKKAYRKMALLHHPDRHSNASATEKAEHEKKFKELGEAYAVLTDPKKRAMHDRGQDVNDPDCGGFSSQTSFDPNQVFAEFFSANMFHGGQGGTQYYDASSPQFRAQQPPGSAPGAGAGAGGGQYQEQHQFQGFPGMSGGFQFGY